jgi:hypothetical protein
MAAANQDPQLNYRKPRPPPGSTITVFVGNITDRASDMLIRQLLSVIIRLVSYFKITAFIII